LNKAKAIDWQQYESVLKAVRPNKKLEIACGDPAASQKVICYTRTLELLVDDYRREPLRRESRPLLEWLARIQHPEANNLLAFNYVLEREMQHRQKALLNEKQARKRGQAVERARRHREFYGSKIVWPDDWIWLTAIEKYGTWRSRYKEAFAKGCELCRKPISEESPLWFHLDRHVARCHSCQEHAWWSDGYEIEAGFPSCFLPETATREERWAVRENKVGAGVTEWLLTERGQAWLATFRAREGRTSPNKSKTHD